MKLFIVFSSIFLLITFNIFSREPLVLSKDFIKDKGEFSCIAECMVYRTCHFWNKHGDKCSAYNRLSQKEIEVFAEYGITFNDTIGINGYFDYNNEELHGVSKGLSDIELDWKHYLFTYGDYSFATRIIGIIPSGKSRTTVCYGHFGAEFDLHCQRDFFFQNREGWIEGMAGYRFYQGFPSDQFKASVVAGYQLFPYFRCIAGAYLDYGIYNGYNDFVGPILTLAPQYRLLKAEIHGVLSMTNYAYLFLGCFQNIWGENIGTGVGYFTGFWIDV